MGWASRPSRLTRVFQRCAWTAYPGSIPFVPLKLGIFQQLRDAILEGQPYEAHGWFISRQNPVLSLPDRKRTLQAFGKMDFIAVVDIIPNDTAWFADVVLPEASYLERFDPLLPVGDKAWIRQPVIEPQGDTKSALMIYKELGTRLGLGDFFQYTDEQDYLNSRAGPLGRFPRSGTSPGICSASQGRGRLRAQVEHAQREDRNIFFDPKSR